MRQHGGEQSGLVALTFDLLTLKVVSESRVKCHNCRRVNFGLPRPLRSRLRPDVCDRQTSDVRQKHRLMPPPIRGGGIIKTSTEILWPDMRHVGNRQRRCVIVTFQFVTELFIVLLKTAKRHQFMQKY